MTRPRKPCRGCGGPKGAGPRRHYCDKCDWVSRWRCAKCGTANPGGPMWNGTRVYCQACSHERDDPARRRRRVDRTRAKRYGLTYDEFDALMARSDVCEACGQAPAGALADGTLAIDHCHESGRVRGLLCGPCNRTLGIVSDSIERLENLIEYLRQHQ